MKRGEISSFLRHSAATAVLANRVRAAMFVESASDSVSQHVFFKNVPHHPTSFAVDVLHVRFVARLEYVKLQAGGKEFLAAQYVFYTAGEKEEVKLQQRLGFVHPGMVLLPSGDEIKFDDGDDDDYVYRLIKDSVSTVLLSEVLVNLEKWKPNEM